jgi:hypothetical protein
MSIIARDATDIDIGRVFARLADDRGAELTASTWHDSTARLAAELLEVRAMTRQIGRAAPMFALFGLDSTVPLAVVGVLPFGPGLGAMVWAATPAWAPHAIPSHRWWRTVFVPEILARYRRVEFTALASDAGSRRWLTGLGFTEEGIAYRQGKRGEDFVHFAWVNPDRTIGITPHA